MAEEVLTHLHRHHDFFQSRVTGTFTDTINGTFDLAGTRRHRGQTICTGQAKVVMAVHRQYCLISRGYVLVQMGNQVGDVRISVAYGIRNIDGGGTGSMTASTTSAKKAGSVRGIFWVNSISCTKPSVKTASAAILTISSWALPNLYLRWIAG